MAGTQRQELKQRPWTNDAYWLAPHILLNLLSYTTKNHLPSVSPASVSWVFLHQENLSTVHSDGGVFPVEVPLARELQICAKLTKTSQHSG